MEMSTYNEKKYALSPYGSLMIKRILDEQIKPKFLIGVSEGVKASGNYDDNYIILPINFPSSKFFSISKQKILGVAIIHYEFEHTKYGKYPLPITLEEEWNAVRYCENPVRIINGLEPRYIYYDFYTELSMNIVTKEIKKGKWKTEKNDPRIMIK